VNANHDLEFPLIVSSCDKYSDLWPIFFNFLFKYWPEIAGNVYLVSNYSKYPDNRVKTIAVGEDRAWGMNMLKALSEIPYEQFIYFQDDYLLSQRVEQDRLCKTLKEFKRLEANYLSLRNFKPNGELSKYGYFEEISKESSAS